MSVRLCSGPPFISAVWRYMEGWGFALVLWVKNPRGWKEGNLWSHQIDGLAKSSTDKETEAQGGTRLVFSVSAGSWQIRSQRLSHMSHRTWDVRYGGVCVSTQLPPWVFSIIQPTEPKPWLINRMDWAYGMKPSAVHAQHHASCPPKECLFPHSMYLYTDRPREDIYGSLNPLAPGKEQGHPNRLLRAIWKSLLFTSSCLVSYLFLCGLLWNLGTDNKAK